MLKKINFCVDFSLRYCYIWVLSRNFSPNLRSTRTALASQKLDTNGEFFFWGGGGVNGKHRFSYFVIVTLEELQLCMSKRSALRISYMILICSWIPREFLIYVIRQVVGKDFMTNLIDVWRKLLSILMLHRLSLQRKILSFRRTSCLGSSYVTDLVPTEIKFAFGKTNPRLEKSSSDSFL